MAFLSTLLDIFGFTSEFLTCSLAHAHDLARESPFHARWPIDAAVSANTPCLAIGVVNHFEQ